MKNILGILLITLSMSCFGQTYKRNFTITSDDKQVGIMSATRSEEGDFVQYDVSSEVSMTILFKISVSYKVQATYKNDLLVASSATVYLNGDVQNDVNVERTGDHYTVTADGHTTRIYEDIRWSSAKLYFNKPVGAKKVLSETDGLLKNISELANGDFRLKDPEKESNVNTYNYSSDQGLNSIDLQRALLPDLLIRSARDPKLDEE